MIKILIIFVILIGPIFLFLLNYLFPLAQFKFIFSSFALLILIERLWETFYTPKEKNITKYGGDWTLVLTSLMYFFACLLILFEYFSLGRNINLYISIFGSVIYIIAAVLRYWGVRSLGDQWAIHAVGESKIERGEHILIKGGPYKYVRHPIYLGIMLELIGIAIVFNSFYSLFFVLFINLPLYIQRAVFEEKSSIDRFGENYLKYKKDVSFIIPFKWFKFQKK